MRLKSYAAAASLVAALAVDPALAMVSGAGATFPDLIYAKWIEAYKTRRASR